MSNLIGECRRQLVVEHVDIIEGMQCIVCTFELGHIKATSGFEVAIAGFLKTAYAQQSIYAYPVKTTFR